MNLKKIAVIIGLVGCFSGCSDVWDEHTKTNKDVLFQNLNEYLLSSPDHSAFAALIKEVGMDQELVSSKQITLFAPNNQAMQAVPAELISTPDARLLFVKNHITYGRLLVGSGTVKERIKMLSSKVLEHIPANNSLGGVTITAKGVVMLNGIFYTTSVPINPLPNIWNYVEKMGTSNEHFKFLNSLTKLTFAPELSTQTGVDEQSRPVYDSVFVNRNYFNDNIVNLSSEDSTLTLFIIQDLGFETEYQKFKPYYKWIDGSTAKDILETKLQISKDYVFLSSYAPGSIPPVLKSANGVTVNFNVSSVVSHFKASNGYVYILSSCPVNLGDRIKTIYLEGENENNYYGLVTEKGVPAGYLRKRGNASGGRDFVLDNHVSGTGDKLTDGLILPAGQLPSISYRVFWRAINDFSTSYRFPTANELRQRMGTCIPMARNAATGRVTRFAPPTIFSQYKNPVTQQVISDYIPVTSLSYTSNPLNDEVLVGTVNFGSIRDVFFQLQPEGVSTRNMAVTVDYVKLVPIFN